MIQAQFEKTFQGWRDEARRLILQATPPEKIDWNEGAPSLFARLSENVTTHSAPTKLTVPQEFVDLAESVAYARDEDRWELLYRILYRLQFENPHLMKISVDPDILRAMLLRKSVRRDIHKMHAFVRFKKTIVDGEELYLAWHRPEHLVVKPGSPFFARRFGDRRWSIFTPEESAHWDLNHLSFGPGMEQHKFETSDDWDEVWKTYYRSIFNPARIKIKAMKLEMSPKYWSSMPETALIRELVREAPQRLQTMAKNHNRSAQVDAHLSIEELREQAKGCTACPLYQKATQTVFGVGATNAPIMIVGEQPGDQEDLTGQPFVGPAGEILNDALVGAGISCDLLYITNAVKHFKWTPRGKTRLHQKPTGTEMHACKPWLEAEIARVKPQVIVALGATAGTAILGRLPKITQERGRLMTNLNIAPNIILSWHPSAILRATEDAEAEERKKQLKEDLRRALGALKR